MLRLALYQPDIPQNSGTMIRMAVCLGIAVDIIEPAAFDVSDRHFRRSGMDYLERAAITRHDSFKAFDAWRLAGGHRLILAETDGATAHTDFAFAPGDIVLVGRESAGVPAELYSTVDGSVHVPMRPGLRSLNVAIAAAVVMGEALRQLDAYPR
ncbi:tRNA (cytidine(34)-2'-O)-methyltransferase [Bosea sp. 2RAB26]|uniref:tRNA (cytidine(34)-2'-O)-methyltransferase n=1 Tax=Bosea sp. 2RAB26 TaxID=3237476 RepID=UPI003F8EABB9